MQVFLAVTPDELRALPRPLPPLAHAAYRIGEGSALLRQELPGTVRGGFLLLSDGDAPVIREPERLAATLLRECGQRNFRGIIADFEQPPTTDRIALLRAILKRSSRGFPLLAPESCAIDGATVLINTAISGGRLTERLQEAIRRHPGAALDLQRLMMVFPLPCPSGEGTPLTAQQLQSIRRQHAPSVFFSPELCARYFTYRRNGQVHFVLFDDAETLRQKLRLAEPMGYRSALVMYPEVRDITEQLFPADRRK